MLVDTKSFREALEVTKFGLAQRAIIESTDAYGFCDGRIYTFNDDIAINHWSPFNNVNADINAKSLQSILKDLSDPHVDVYCSDFTFHIDGKLTSASLPASQTSYIREYFMELAIPSVDSDIWKSVSTDLGPQARKAIATVSTNMARPILNCLHWSNDAMESTDNYSVTRCTLASAHPEVKSILIPNESASVLLKFDPTAFVCTGDWLHFKTKQKAIVSIRTFEGVFPDLSKCLSRKPRKFIEFPPNFLAILKRVSKFAADGCYLGSTKEAKISIDKGALTVQVRVRNGRIPRIAPSKLQRYPDFHRRSRPSSTVTEAKWKSRCRIC